MTGPSAFSLRRLGPFQGVMQVVQGATARAFSNDGRIWQLQVTRAGAGPGSSRLDPDASAPVYLNSAVWSADTGLRDLPLDPMFELSDLASIRRSGGELAAALAPLQDRQPFPAADTLEYWLLDGADGLPLALLESRLPGRAAPQRGHPQWQPGTAGPEVARLQQGVRAAAGARPEAAWFERGPDGRGQPLAPGRAAQALAAADFPPLLLRRDWADPELAALAEAYLVELAPRLLLLHRLPVEVRGEVESWAVRQAAEVARWHHLYPQVVEPKLLRRALVETRLRRSQGDAS